MNSSKIKVKKLIRANDLAMNYSEKRKLDDLNNSEELSSATKNISSLKGVISKPEKPVSIEDMKEKIKLRLNNEFD
jgi:hypothetical protein